MALIFYLKQYDKQPYYNVKLLDSDGKRVALGDATILCTMKNIITNELKINRRNLGIIIADQSLAKGEFQLRWQDGDTDTVGEYDIEFEISPATEGKFTIPNGDDEAKVIITAGLDTE